MLIRAYASYGFVGAEHENEWEVDDKATDEEILDEVWEWASQYIDCYYEKVPNGDSK